MPFREWPFTAGSIGALKQFFRLIHGPQVDEVLDGTRGGRAVKGRKGRKEVSEGSKEQDAKLRATSRCLQLRRPA